MTSATAEDYYMYVKNLQGDVVAVADESGNVLVEYIYSAYGEFFVEYATTNTELRTILDYSPFRYRGYIYDEESGFYYLNSRYYDPQVGRFVNADNHEIITASPSALTDKNLYAYCDNNPVMRTDHGGDIWNVIAGAVVGAAVSFVTAVVPEIVKKMADPEYEIDWVGVGISTVFGAVEGALTALCPGASALISAISGAAETGITGWRSGQSFRDTAIDMVWSGALGAATGSWGSNFKKGGSVMNNYADAIVNRIKKATPTAKRTLGRAARKAWRQVGGEFGSGIVSSVASDFSSWYGSEYTKRFFNYGIGA